MPPSCGLADLYVAGSAAGAFTKASPTRGRGIVWDPFVRITDAVARARAERAFGALPSEDEIRIHVAPGTYVGSFDAAALQQHTEYEVLPIIVNVPKLTLLGATVLVRDERGLPIAAAPEGRTILQPDEALGPNQYLVLVTRTADGAIGDGVTIDGFVFDGIAGGFPGADIFIDRVSGFDFRNNLVTRSAFGVMTRLSSGTIEGNLLADNLELGSVVTGGSLAQPATVVIHANRAIRNVAHGFGQAVVGWIKLRTDSGQNVLALLEPLQTVFDRNNPEDVRNIPDTLSVTLNGNDASDNGDPIGCCGGTGIRLAGIWPDYAYDTADTNQPVTSVLTAHVSGNTCDRNVSYGVILEAGDTQRFYPRRFIQTLTVDFDGNAFIGNGRAPALFTFNYWLTSVGPTSPLFERFAEASTYAVRDGDGELAGFDYDNPVTDPISGIVLGNSLTVNGVEMPHGTSITPQ